MIARTRISNDKQSGQCEGSFDSKWSERVVAEEEAYKGDNVLFDGLSDGKSDDSYEWDPMDLLETNPAHAYENLVNFHSTLALIGGLLLCFAFSMEGQVMNLEEMNICQTYSEWIATGGNYKFNDGAEDGCEVGCRNVWQTCFHSHLGIKIYKIVLYSLCSLLLGLILFSTNTIALASMLPRSSLSHYWLSLPPYAKYIEQFFWIGSTAMFAVTGILQASLTLDIWAFVITLIIGTSLFVLAVVFFHSMGTTFYKTVKAIRLQAVEAARSRAQ